MRVKKVIGKYAEYALTKIKILYAQRSFEQEGIRVKYLLKRGKNPDALVIVFSSCTRKGIKARYNYVRTLSRLNCSRLHILDDYAKDGRASYYLGADFTFGEERAAESLIQKIIRELSPRKVIYCGSSKGGYAALDFGLQREGAYIIAGAPQYYLASYLTGDSRDNCTYRHIVGEDSPEKFEAVEYHLRDRIREGKYVDTQKIYLHYSDREHTYKEHIRYLLGDLREKGCSVTEDVRDYTSHSDISYYFPEYLIKTINRIMEEHAENESGGRGGKAVADRTDGTE